MFTFRAKLLSAGVILLATASAPAWASTINLIQTYTTTPVLGTDNVLSMNVTDDQGNPVNTVFVGGVTASAMFNAATDGDGQYLSVGQDTPTGTNGYRIGTIVYKFSAPTGATFSGNFNVGLMMAVQGIETGLNAWGTIDVNAETDSTSYTTLQSITSRQGTTDNATIGHSFNGSVGFDVTGKHDVYIQFVMTRRFFSDFTQMAYADFQGQTTVVPEPASLGLLGAGLLLLPWWRRRYVA